MMGAKGGPTPKSGGKGKATKVGAVPNAEVKKTKKDKKSELTEPNKQKLTKVNTGNISEPIAKTSGSERRLRNVSP